MTETNRDLNTIAMLLDSAILWGLSSEVVYTALKYMKDNPDRSIEEAISYGYNEWVK